MSILKNTLLQKTLLFGKILFNQDSTHQYFPSKDSHLIIKNDTDTIPHFQFL